MAANKLGSAAFTVGFYTWSIVLGLAMIPTLALPRAALRFCVRLWVRGVAWMLRRCARIDVAIEGWENVPAPPYIVAAKHQSEWEANIFVETLPDPVYVIKKELLRIPLYGLYAIKMGMIFVDRQGRTKAMRTLLRAAKARIAQNRPIVIFPEGTRVRVGERLPYHPGVAALYSALGVPVVPAVHNSGMHWPKQTYRKHPGTIRLRFLPPIPPGLPPKEFRRRLETTMEGAWEELYARESGLERAVVHERLKAALERHLTATGKEALGTKQERTH